LNSGKSIFSQLMDFVPRYEFHKCVQRYNGQHKVKSFSCWDQFLTMAFAQLTYRESLRDIQACLRAAGTKLYHLGIRSRVSRNTLANANQVRDWRIYADFAQRLIGQARRLYANEEFGVELDQTAYALDSTTIDLCLSLFPWAKFRRHKAAVKLHTLLDLRGSIPRWVVITDGKVHDVNLLDQLVFEAGAFYIFDRGYVDFARLYRIHQSSAFFVTRAKSNFEFHRLCSQAVDKSTGVLSDQIIRLKVFTSRQGYRRTCGVFITSTSAQPATGAADQQLHSLGSGHCRALPLPLASRTLFQMDQAAPAHQSVLWDKRQCRQNSSLDRHLSLRLGGNYQKATQPRSESLQHSPGTERHAFRENPDPTGFLSHRPRTRKGQFL
jgi:hypothetical protein